MPRKDVTSLSGLLWRRIEYDPNFFVRPNSKGLLYMISSDVLRRIRNLGHGFNAEYLCCLVNIPGILWMPEGHPKLTEPQSS